MPHPKINVLLEGEKLDAQVLGQLSRLEVRETDCDPSAASLRFTLVQQEGGEFRPLDDDLFRPAVALAIDVEAPGGTPTRLFDGFVTHLRPHFEAIESNCYLEVLALDALMLLDAHERVETYPDQSDSEAVEAIFSRYQLASEVESTEARHAQDRQLLVQRGTDWEFIRRLAWRNGFCCYLEPDPAGGPVKAFFRSRQLEDSPQADLTVLRDGTNLKWVDVQYVMSGPVRHAGAAIDPLAKRIVRSEGETKLPPLGDALAGEAIEQGLTGAGVEKATALLRDLTPQDAALNALGTAATDRDQFVVEARGELTPSLYRGLLRARRPVLLKGVGRRFAGSYYVRSVRTVMEEGDLTQTFIAERNALDLRGGEDFGQSAEEVEAQ